MKQFSFSTNFRIAEPFNLDHVFRFYKPKKEAMDSCRDGWNLQNGLNAPEILHSVGERVDCVLLLVLVVLLSKYIKDLILNKKHCKSLCWGKYMNLLMLLWKIGCIGYLECQDILVVNRKNSCLSCFICAQWNQSF